MEDKIIQLTPKTDFIITLKGSNSVPLACSLSKSIRDFSKVFATSVINDYLILAPTNDTTSRADPGTQWASFNKIVLFSVLDKVKDRKELGTFCSDILKQKSPSLLGIKIRIGVKYSEKLGLFYVNLKNPMLDICSKDEPAIRMYKIRALKDKNANNYGCSLSYNGKISITKNLLQEVSKYSSYYGIAVTVDNKIIIKPTTRLNGISTGTSSTARIEISCSHREGYYLMKHQGKGLFVGEKVTV